MSTIIPSERIPQAPALRGRVGHVSVPRPEDFEEWPSHLDEQSRSPWVHHVRYTKELDRLAEPLQAISHIESRLKAFDKKLQSAIDIGLENRKLLEQLHEEGSPGLGAIHSLDQGHVQLAHPLLYSYQAVDDQVVVGIEEFGVYGVGSTEGEAVVELQEELWNLVKELERTPPEKLGAHLTKTLRTLMGRIRQDAMDA